MTDKSSSKKTRTNVPWAVVINNDPPETQPDIQEDDGLAEDTALELEFEAWEVEATDGEPDPVSDEAPGEEAGETEPKPAVNGKADTEPADEDDDAEFEAVRALVAAAEGTAQPDRQEETGNDPADSQLDAEPPVPAEDGPGPDADGDGADEEVTAAGPAEAADAVEESAPQETAAEPEPDAKPNEAAESSHEPEAEPAEADRQPAAQDAVGEEAPAPETAPVPETAASEMPREEPETESEPAAEPAEAAASDGQAKARESTDAGGPAPESAASEEPETETQSVEAETVSAGEADTEEPDPEPEAPEPEPEPEPKPETAAASEPEAAGGETQDGDAEAEQEQEQEQDGEVTPVAAKEQDAPADPAELEEADAEPAAEVPERKEGACDDAVVRSLMDVLITPAGVVQPQERAFAADLLLHIMDYATDDARHMLCDRLAKMPDAPAALVSRFVKDGDLEISSRLLLEASCVSDSELVSVVESGDRARALLVAQRRHLSAAVGTALAKTGDLELSLELVRNKHVQLSFEALERLSVLAREHDELLDPLVMRPDMSAACALDLFWAMTAKQRAYALGRFLAEVQVLPQILVMGKPGADLVAAALRSGDTKADGQQQEKPAKKKAAALIEALEAGDAGNLESHMVDCAGVEPQTAERIVADSGSEALAVVCKALGVSRFAFGGALGKWQTASGHAPTSEAMQILFDTLSFRQARMALTYWDWQVLKVGPYAAERSS